MKRRCIIGCLLILACSFSFADEYHVIRSGETLYKLSRIYGISVDELKRANNITDVTEIYIGTKIRIPGESPQSAATTYRVRKGDTLYSIARRNGMKLNELLALNSLDSSHVLKVGEVLKLNSDAPAAAEQSAEVSVAAAPDETPPVPTPNDTPDFFWPHNGERISLKGKLMGKEINGHNGDPVLSVSSGRVIWVAPYHGYGKIVMVESPDKHIFAYGGNADTLVNVGDTVRPGQKLGLLGASGQENRAKVFFFVYKNGKPVDPDLAPRK